MKKVIIIFSVIFLTINIYAQNLAGKTYFQTGPEIEASYSFTRTRFTYNFDELFNNQNIAKNVKSYFYEIKYIDKLPFLYYGKEPQDNKKNQLVLFNDDYLFIFDSDEKKSFLEPIYFNVYCSGKYTTDAKGDTIITSVFNKRYSSVLKEKEHEYYLADENYISPWIPDLKKDYYPTITFSIIPYDYKSGRQKIILVNGFVNPIKPYLFEQNSRVKSTEIVFRNSKTKEVETCQIVLEDTPNPQYIFIPENIKVDEIEIRIKDIYKGNKYTDVAISYIGF